MSLRPVEIPLGAMRFNSDSQKLEYWNGDIWMQVHTFSPNLDGGVRALFAGGYHPSPSPGTCTDTVDKITISTAGNATDWCNLTAATMGGGNLGDSTRAVYAGGRVSTTPGGSGTNQIQFTTFATQGDYADSSGDLSASKQCSGLANSTRGIFAGFIDPYADTIDYITIQSIGNAQDFGNLTATRGYTMQCASPTRGLFAGGINNPSSPSINIIDYVEIASTGNAQDFGDVTGGTTAYEGTAFSNSTRGFTAGGYRGSYTDIIDFVTIATKGNAQNFGDTDEPGYFKTGVSSSTRGVFTQGRIYNPSGGTGSVDMEYITIATKGDGIQFGDLVGGGRVTLCNAAMSPTRGILAGGVASPVGDPTTFVNTIEYVTMATLGNSVNFGDLKKSGGGGRSNGNCSSNTRGVFSVGTQSPADGNVLNFITIATTGDALDFGDLSGGMQMRGACSNKTRGLFAGGFVAPGSANYVNTCEKIIIATTGSASDWGDTFEGEDGRGYNSGISDSHGGLS